MIEKGNESILYYVRKIYPDAVHRDKHLGKELDIYIPSIRVAIEYDGELAHKAKKDLKMIIVRMNCVLKTELN